MVSAPFRPVLLVVMTMLFTIGVGSARADSVALDFETGPAPGAIVGDDYLLSHFVKWLPADSGFRPERRDDAAHARSGSFVVDVGGGVCQDQAAQAIDCEFPHIASVARLTRTATTVTLYAGLFTASPNIGAKLTGYNAAGNVVVTGPVVPLPTSSLGSVSQLSGKGQTRAVVKLPPHRFTTPITITRSQGDIAMFRLDAVDSSDPNGSAAIGATLGYDDLTLDYPANSLPDVSIWSPSQASVLDGLSTDVPITLTRLNASSGPLAMSVSGLPTGVTGTVTPNPVPTGTEAATLHLVASPTAPRVDNLADVVVTADPQNNGNVAPGIRTTHVGLRVASPYELTTTSASTVPIGACTAQDVPFVVARDGSFTGTTNLTVEHLPAGVTADILPSSTVPPGGNFFADRTVRFTAAAGASFPGNVTIRASSPGLPDRTLIFNLTKASGTASIDPSSLAAKTPQHLHPGTTVTVNGNGLCPGTQVQVGNSQALVDAAVAADGKSLTFVTPRTASTGPVLVRPPVIDNGFSYNTTNSLTVDNFRNTVGFQFHNPSYGWLSYSELTDAFGSEDMWITINPCWPWGTCRVNTGIPDPLSYAEWGVLNIALHESGGHCFGITRAAENLRLGKVPYSQFAPGALKAFDLPGAAGPEGSLGSYLDGQHALQGSAEFLSAWAHRDRNASGQLATLGSELSQNRDPIVTMSHPSGLFGEGHAVLAYDEEAVPGGTDIYVYDNNRQSSANGDPGGTMSSVIQVRGNHWSMTMADGTPWTGDHGDGSLFITPQSTIPSNPSLPSLSSLGDLPAMVFGADGNAAHATGATPGATTLPALDTAAEPNTAGWLVGTTPTAPLATTVTGAKDGTYSAAVSGPGFAGAVTDVATKAGVQDVAGGNASGHAVTFDSGQDRPLNVTLATVPKSGAAARAAVGDAPAGAPTSAESATVQTHASKGGTDTAGLTTGGALSYQHQGKPTTFSFTLTSTDPNGGPQRFVSPTVSIAGGDRVTATPVGQDLAKVAVVVRSKSGKIVRKTLKNKAKAPAHLKLTALKAPKKGMPNKATVNVTLSGLAPDTTGALGVVLRVMKGKHVVASLPTSNAAAGNSTTPISWSLPKLAKGRYQLVADARVAVGGTAGGSATAHKSVVLKVS